jgi:hypothetical protein
MVELSRAGSECVQCLMNGPSMALATWTCSHGWGTMRAVGSETNGNDFPPNAAHVAPWFLLLSRLRASSLVHRWMSRSPSCEPSMTSEMPKSMERFVDWVADDESIFGKIPMPAKLLVACCLLLITNHLAHRLPSCSYACRRENPWIVFMDTCSAGSLALCSLHPLVL